VGGWSDRVTEELDGMAYLRGKDFGREPAGKRPLDGRIVLKRILKK